MINDGILASLLVPILRQIHSHLSRSVAACRLAGAKSLLMTQWRTWKCPLRRTWFSWMKVVEQEIWLSWRRRGCVEWMVPECARMCQSFVSLICVNFDVWIARRGGEICENSLHGSSFSPRRRIYQVLHDSCLKEAILLYTWPGHRCILTPEMLPNKTQKFWSKETCQWWDGISHQGLDVKRKPLRCSRRVNDARCDFSESGTFSGA